MIKLSRFYRLLVRKFLRKPLRRVIMKAIFVENILLVPNVLYLGYVGWKAFLELQGYEVKAEVKGCDVVAVRGDEAPVIVELKQGLTIALLLQGVDRQSITDFVYVAVERKPSAAFRRGLKDAVKLCRRLGLGLMSVRLAGGVVEVHCDPAPYQPRKMPKRRSALLGEFHRRSGDPNIGGQVGKKLMTAYRQDALRIAAHLLTEGQGRPAAMRDALDVPKAAAILQDNHYGWFYRVERGVYALSDAGAAAVKDIE